MRVVIDIEANGLENPTKIWCIICKDIDTGKIYKFRNLTTDIEERHAFEIFSKGIKHWIGHNFLDYDYPVIRNLLCITLTDVSSISTDTLIISKMVDYSRPTGHSIEAYGEEFGLEKDKFSDYSKWSQELENRCERDVMICDLIYHKYNKIINDLNWHSSIALEHRFQLICNDLHTNGFGFDKQKASKLLTKVTEQIEELDKDILSAFPPREVLIREFTPKETKYGTISKTSVPRSRWDDIHTLEIGKTYKHTKLMSFNPSSHKQIVEVLIEAKWHPENKTQTHINTERELNRLKYSREDINPLDIQRLSDKLKILRTSGWKIDETNLSTLPSSAPPPARLLARRILLESRRRTLTEWLNLVRFDGRVHGKFYGIGAWTHRMAHQKPNTANIPSEKNLDGSTKLLGREMRELWCSPKGKLLLGVDAEGIQLRIFAHLINDPEFTRSLVEGRKDDKTDPHSLNQRILGSVCKTRASAKRFIFALLLGAGLEKLAIILGCSKQEAEEALGHLLSRYTGFAKLKQEVIPNDAKRGYFIGLDGRKLQIPGDTIGTRKHLAMSGYLQSGEAIVIKKSAIIIDEELQEDKLFKHWMFVDIVHDEFQSEIINDMEVALRIAKIKANAIKLAGEELGLRCPLAGSYWNDDTKKYTIGTNWYRTH